MVESALGFISDLSTDKHSSLFLNVYVCYPVFTTQYSSTPPATDVSFRYLLDRSVYVLCCFSTVVEITQESLILVGPVVKIEHSFIL